MNAAACIAFNFIGALVMMKLFAQNVNNIHITSVLACLMGKTE